MKTIKNLKAEEIRKSILQLAIQGKLVKQNPNDEPASELVKKIYEEKKKLIAEGKIKKDKTESFIFKGDDNCYYEKISKNEPVKLEDLPFDIPDNWTWIKMESSSLIVVGATPSTSNSAYWNNGTIPWLPSGCCQDCEVYDTYPKIKYITESGYNSCSTTIMKKNTVLIALTGATAGKVGILKFEACANQSVVGISPYYGINTRFMFLQLMARRNEILADCVGSAQPHISKEYVTNMYFALPPLEEQQRIVEKINSFEPLIQEYDKYEKQLTELESTFAEKLKKSILQYAIEGKLVKQDPNDEPASALLERIKAEKEKLIKEGKIKRDKNESYIYQDDDKNYYENLPNNYTVTYLSFAGIWRSGTTPQRGNNEYYSGDIPWIKTGELNNSIIYDSLEKVTKIALLKCSLPINDVGNVLIAMYGATIGKLAIAGIPLTTNQACCGCKPYSGIYNKYLFYYLMANKQRFIDSAEGGAQPNISREKIMAYPFVLPPFNEQIKISDKLDFILNQISC